MSWEPFAGQNPETYYDTDKVVRILRLIEGGQPAILPPNVVQFPKLSTGK